MSEFAIITDSSCDLDKTVRSERNIEYVPMYITYKGKEIPASLDWDLYTPQEFYDYMKAGNAIKTNQVSIASFMEAFEKHLKEGRDVLYVGCTSGLSGSVNTGIVVAGELNEKYENKVYCVDTLNSCIGLGLMALVAADMRDAGKSVTEVKDYLEANKLNYHQVGTIETLTYLKRAGRVKASAAFFGNLFGVKPIIIFNRAGENYAFKKVKGRKNSIDEIIKIVKDNILEPETQTVAIAHANCIADAEYIKTRLEAEVKPKSVYINYMGPIIGGSTGPDTLGIYFKGKEREF